MTHKLKIAGNLNAAHKFQQFFAEESHNLRQYMAGQSSAPEVCAVSTKQEEAILQNIPTDGLKSDVVFNIIKTRMDEEPELVKAFKFVIQFNITRNGKVVAVWSESKWSWLFNCNMMIAATDTKTEGGQVYRANPKVKPDAIVNVDDENYVNILFGKLNPQRVRILNFSKSLSYLLDFDSGFHDRKDRCQRQYSSAAKVRHILESSSGTKEWPRTADRQRNYAQRCNIMALLNFGLIIFLFQPLKPGLKSEMIMFDLIQKLVRLPNLLDAGSSVLIQISKDGTPASKWRK